MEHFGIDRIKICNDLNIKYTTFVDWLNAKTYPRIDKIELMANYFGIQKSDLVEPKELNNNQIIGNKIKSLRLKHKMTLYSLSQKINLSESTIQRYENGKIASISMNVIENFAQALNVPATVLLNWENENEGYYTNADVAKYAEELRQNSDMRLLFDVAQDISKEDLELIVNIIKDLKKRSK